MVTFADTCFYSNILHKLGKQALSVWIEKYPGTLHKRFKKIFVLDGMELILNYIFFQFDNKNNIKTFGSVLGNEITPTYATPTLA